MTKIPGVWGGHGHPKYRTIPHTDSPKSPKPGSFLVSFNNPLASQVRQGTCLVLSTILSLRLTTQSHTNWQFYNFYNFYGDYFIMIYAPRVKLVRRSVYCIIHAILAVHVNLEAYFEKKIEKK